MSTKVYNAYIVKIAKINDLFETLRNLKTKVQDLQKEIVMQSLIQDIAHYQDLNKLQIASTEYPNITENIYSSFSEFYEKTYNNPNDDLMYEYFSCGLVVIPYDKKHVVFKFFTRQEAYIKLFDSIFEDFHYQNSTDKPDEITQREWKKREKFWDNLNGSYKDNGLEYSLTLSLKQLLFEIYRMNKKELINSQPSIDKRISLLIYKLADKEYSMLLGQDKEFSFSDYCDEIGELRKKLKNEKEMDFKAKLQELKMEDVFLDFQLKE